VNTESKAIFAVASFHNLSGQLQNLRGVIILVSLSAVVSTYKCLQLSGLC